MRVVIQFWTFSLLALLAWGGLAHGAGTTLLNVSFDITRELFADLNPAFEKQWVADGGKAVTLRQSHGGSSKQARAVIDGLAADIVTMNQAADVDMIARLGGQVPANWRERLPNSGVPFYSTIVFLVRKGNPKQIRDWQDLVKPGVEVVIPNPKTSGNGRYSLLAAYGAALRRAGGDTNAARDYLSALIGRVPVWDTGGRGATTSFIERGVGDVLLSFEAEVLLAARDSGTKAFEAIVPPVSIRADISAAVVEKVAARRGTKEAAEAYAKFLFSDEAQEIVAKNLFRPTSEGVSARHASQFPKIELLEPERDFGGWKAIQTAFFDEGALFDQLQRRR